MKKCITLCLFFIVTCSNVIQAQDSSHLRISLLTCTPGDELYSTFGHSAIRITDSTSLTDYVFNYGTFNFDDEGFYLKFVQGKLLYYLSVEQFKEFAYDYQASNRGITEQELTLTAAEKLAFQQKLLNNTKEANRYYLYDFFMENCTTRLRDLVVQSKPNNKPLKAIVPATLTYRQAIHYYLDKYKKYWSKLGIDLLLGHPTDAVMTVPQTQFLPNNLMRALDSSNQQQSWITSKKQLYPFNEPAINTNIFSPLFVFSLILVIILALSFWVNKFAAYFLQGFDAILFFLTGVLGIILIFMWTATNHAMCANNYNLLWTLPSHAVMAFFVRSKSKWVRYYFGATAIVTVLLLLSWFFLPQRLNNDFLPLILLLLYRAAAIYYNFQPKPRLNYYASKPS
jgi:hypothetical protein